MNIQYLEEFLTIAKYKSFSEASDELSIGQSALSKHISALEKELDVLLIPYELAKGMKETKELIRSIEPGKSIGVFIGPEGGFEEQEVADAMEAGAKPITLGHRILRTETAGLAVLSVLMFQLEDE